MRRLFIVLALVFSWSFPALGYSGEKCLPEVNAFITSYYKKPDLKGALLMLEKFLGSPDIKDLMDHDRHTYEMIAYFFGRIAEMKPGILRRYMDVYENTNRQGRAFLLSVFTIYRNKKVDRFLNDKLSQETDKDNLLSDVLNKPPLGRKTFVVDVKDVNNLDFLWIEFFLTGEKEPLVKMIDVLDWSDKFASKLQRWMSERHTSEERQRMQDIFANELKVDIDIDNYRIDYFYDLDILFSTYLNNAGSPLDISEYGVELRNLLDITEEDISYMGTKGAARWSLISNAQTHPRVLYVLKNEINQREGKARRELEWMASIVENGGRLMLDQTRDD